MKKHILVIDDVEGIRESFTLALENLPFEVNTAKNGEDGIEKAKKQKPDLVFLDLKMPGINGVETMTKLLAIYPELPIYIMTAFFEEFMKELDKARSNDLKFEICRKPIGYEQIEFIIKSILKS